MDWQDRFWAKVDKTIDGCWPWNGYRDKDGYGQIMVNGRMQQSNRASWLLHYGEIRDRLQVLHHCDNPPCVNPEHLYLGTHQDNMDDREARGRNANKSKTHCPQGHPYSEDNLYIDGIGHRHCKICKKIAFKKWYVKDIETNRKEPDNGTK